MGLDYKSAAQLLQYCFKVMPDMHRISKAMDDLQLPCSLHSFFLENTSSETVIGFPRGISALCAGYLALCPDTDYKSTLSFIYNIYSLSEILEAYRLQKSITDETEIRKLFGCLPGAVDPSRSTGCYLKLNSDGINLSRNEIKKAACLSDQCRLQLATLPSFPLVAQKLKKYMQLYIDLKSYSHYPEAIRNNYLEAWSSGYLKCCRQISFWEFCGASSSLAGIVAMYSAATNPKLSKADVLLLDEVFFPWLCGFESLLGSYVIDRMQSDGGLRLTSFYNNLKECEERITFFGNKAAEACMKLNGKVQEFYLSYLKFLAAMFLSDSEAGFGLKKIATGNIRKKLLDNDILSYYICKLLHIYYKL